jgi:uncharacterized FlaG/YvyC family protein
MLLAVKSVKKRYHVYTHGEHNHPIKFVAGHQKLEKKKEDEEEKGKEMIEDEHQQEGKQEDSIAKITEAPLANETDPREETLEEKLQKATAKVYKWMEGIEPNQIDATLGDWNNTSLLKVVKMADQEIREHPEKFL